MGIVILVSLMIGQVDAKTAFEKATKTTFAEARAKSEIPIICFVGTSSRNIKGFTVVQEDTLKDWPKCIIVAVPTKEGWDAYEMPISSTDLQLKERARLGQEREARRRTPVTFREADCVT